MVENHIMRKTITFAVLLGFILCAAYTGAQDIQTAKISSIRIDGSLVLDAGMNQGFEQGDILVVQRQGTKIGLAHITEVGPASSTAAMSKTEPGRTARVGDLCAYQMLAEISAAERDSGSRVRQVIDIERRSSEKLPNIMKKKWRAPAEIKVDYDKIINNQLAILKDRPEHRIAMLRLADAYFKKAWYEHSIKWNQKAIKLDPQSPDNDKLIYQIIRAYGLLNKPDKQVLYTDYIQKYYPDSVFTAMLREEADIRSPKLVRDYGTVPIVDEHGFQKGGMKILVKGGMSKIKNDESEEDLIGDKLLHGKPTRINPQTVEP